MANSKSIFIEISPEQECTLELIAERYRFLIGSPSQNRESLSRLFLAIAEGTLQVMPAIESATKDNNLERFIGSWADMTSEENQVFQEILAERPTRFHRSLPAIFEIDE